MHIIEQSEFCNVSLTLMEFKMSIFIQYDYIIGLVMVDLSNYWAAICRFHWLLAALSQSGLEDVNIK